MKLGVAVLALVIALVVVLIGFIGNDPDPPRMEGDDAVASGLKSLRADDGPRMAPTQGVVDHAVSERSAIPDHSTRRVLVRVVDPLSGVGRPGVLVTASEGREPVYGEGVRVPEPVKRTWDRTLIRTDGGVVGFPTPKRFGRSVKGAEGAQPTLVSDSRRTDADGTAILNVLATSADLTVRASDTVRAATVTVPRGEHVAKIALPATAHHVYQLSVSKGAIDPPYELFVVHRATQTVLKLRRSSANEFLGPVPGEWAPFLYASSGYRLAQPIDIRGRKSPTLLVCEALNPVTVVCSETRAPINLIQVVTYDRESFSVQDVQESRSRDGKHFLGKSSNQAARLLIASGYRSTWVDDPLPERVAMDPGDDPVLELEVHARARKLEFVVCPVAPGTRAGDFLGAGALSRLLHTGLKSRHRLPSGWYFITCTDQTIPAKCIEVRPGAISRVVFEVGATLTLRHKEGESMSATDRFGRTVVKLAGEQEIVSLLQGLAFGPIMVRVGTYGQFVYFTDKQRIHDIKSGIAAAEQRVALPDGWSPIGSKELRQEFLVSKSVDTADFAHVNGARAKLLWKDPSVPFVRLPESFAQVVIGGLAGEWRATIYAGPFAFRLTTRPGNKGLQVHAPGGFREGLLVVSRRGRSVCVVQNEFSGRIPPSETVSSKRFRYTSLAVDPGNGGAYVVVMSGRSVGDILDSCYVRRAERWRARVPLDTSGCCVVAISGGGITREPLSVAVLRGSVRTR